MGDSKAQCSCDDRDPCTYNDHCDGFGGCNGDPKKITGVEVTANGQARLIPAGETGELRLELVEPDSHAIPPPVQLAGGTHNRSFNIPALTPGDYNFVRGTWTVGEQEVQGQLSYHILVLGNWRHSQYNVPVESGCAGGPRATFLSPGIAQCFNNITSPNATLLSDFADQTALNGTGVSDFHGTIKAVAATSCTRPPGSTSANAFVQVPNITGACNTTLDNNSLAACEGDARLPCDATIYIHGIGTKTVRDECPACCGHNQLDNFTLSPACRPGQIPDLGRFMTIRIFN